MPSFTHAPLPHQGTLLERPADHLPIAKLGRFTLITAAAGYGKTVLLSQWAKQAVGTVAWFNPVRVYQPEEILPGILLAVRMAIGDQRSVDPGQWQDPEATSDEVREAITKFADPLTLVIDGTQFVGGDPTVLQESLRMLVERQPPKLALVVTSRNVPIAAAEIAQMNGRLDLIDQSSLSIPDDVVTTSLQHKGATRELAQEMAQLFRGWPAAIGMVLGMPQLPEDLDVFRASISDQGLIRFLSESLIDRITPDLREALIKTSVAEVISPQLALDLGLTPEEAGSLLTAYHQGVPITRVDNKDSFALHQLFRDQLLERLRRQNPALERLIRQDYADYLLKNRDPRAIDQFIAIGDLQRAKETLNDYVHVLIESGLAVQVSKWLKVLDTQYSDRIEYLRRRIYTTIVEGDIVRVQSLLDSFLDEMEQLDAVNADNMAFYHLNLAWVALNVGDIEEMYDQARKTLTLKLSADNPRTDEYLDTARSYVARYKTFVYQAGESDPEVRASFTASNPGAVSWKDIQLPGMRSHVAIYRGEVNKALAYGERALAAVPPSVMGTIFFPWFGLVGVSGALREQGEAKRTIDVIDEYYEDLLRLHPLVYLVDILTIRAGALADLGRMSEATETYLTLRELVDRYGRGWWINDRLDFQEARFLLRHGDESRALQLASRLRDSSTLPSLTLQLDIQSAPKRAAQTLTTLKRETPIQEMNFRLFSALLSKDQPEQSDQHLKHLLALMEEHGTMRVVVDRGRDAVDLVSVYVSRHPSRYGENLVARMQDALSTARPTGLVAPLSKREQQILGMLATSMTLKQISDALFVSQNTLKTHLRHLYRKMQVGGRDQAVEEGRKLLLLP